MQQIPDQSRFYIWLLKCYFQGYGFHLYIFSSWREENPKWSLSEKIILSMFISKKGQSSAQSSYICKVQRRVRPQRVHCSDLTFQFASGWFHNLNLWPLDHTSTTLTSCNKPPLLMLHTYYIWLAEFIVFFLWPMSAKWDWLFLLKFVNHSICRFLYVDLLSC